MKHITAVTMTAVLAFGGVSLAACSSSSTEESGEMVGADPGTWAPIEVTQSTNGTTVDMVVGQAAIFTDLPDSPTVMVESSDPMVVEASQAEGEGDVTAVAGLVARGAGTATITVVDTSMAEDAGGASNVIIQFTVNVSAE
jgi:hypothetical protein